jgi:OmpA-OmpF porin, OOP family
MKYTFVVLLLSFSGSLFAQEFSMRYELVNLGKTVNTHYHEAAPIVTPDGKTLYYFIQNHPQNTFGKEGSQDIWSTTQDSDGHWGAPQHLGSPFNQHRSNQVFAVLPDGTLFIRGGRAKNSKGFSMVAPGGRLEELDVIDFSNMNKGRFYGASMSADGKHMILSFSEVAASIRSSMYVSNLQADGKWSKPVPLNISDRSDEFGPFIAPDDQTLYFASDRRGPNTQGGADIYMTTRLDDTWKNWSLPVNLGPPINTRATDAYFCMDREGNVYVSRSNSTVDGGNLDLFVLLPREIKINLVGKVTDEKTGMPVQAKVELNLRGEDPYNLKTSAAGEFQSKLPERTNYNLNISAGGYINKQESFTLPELTNDTTVVLDIYLTPVKKQLVLAGEIFDSKTGEKIDANLEIHMRGEKRNAQIIQSKRSRYEQDVSQMGWYMITANTGGYLSKTDSIHISSDEVSPVIKDIYLNPIEVGLTVRLNNIYFDFDRATLKRESFVELDKVVDFLKENPTVEIEISGHTDGKGSADYNLRLSQGRAQSVVDYVIGQGIDGYRLIAKGYGLEKPVATNDTEEGRATNRRVEFTVLKK